jgi:serine/threonine-protein kinase CHEK2
MPDVAPEILENSKRRRYTKAVDIWSLGVVLYICLCGFPPFSDELNTPENPYTLAQQIKMARFDYPSPYWDSVGDPALDLIDKMLVVDPEKRATVEECLEHPWIVQKGVSLTDSTDGLTGAIGQLDFSHRKPVRERTLLSSINDVKVEHIVKDSNNKQPTKIWDKNGNTNGKASKPKGKKQPKQEETPAETRDPNEFMEMGGKGDQQLYSDHDTSNYHVGKSKCK